FLPERGWSRNQTLPESADDRRATQLHHVRGRHPEKRQYGYYVLPFLLGDRIVARIDVKADRPAGTLRVHAAFAEPEAPRETAARLLEELKRTQAWLELDRLNVKAAGNLGPALTDMAMS